MTTTQRTLLEELEAIDRALLDGTATRKQEKRGQEIVNLADAAPDMQQALERCIALWDDLNANMADEGEVEVWNTTRAAIAKAKGGEV
jgi:hypothetical protein